MPDQRDPTVLFVTGLAAGLYWFVKGFLLFRKYRVLADTPRVPIRSVAMGLAEIHGTASGEELMRSPIRNRPCFFYKVEIETWAVNLQGNGSWQHLATDTKGLQFYLQDETGKILVDPSGAELDLTENCQRVVGRVVPDKFRQEFTTLLGDGQEAESGLSPGASEVELLEYVGKVSLGQAVPRFVTRAAADGQENSPPSDEARESSHSLGKSRIQGSWQSGRVLGRLNRLLRGGSPSSGGRAVKGMYRLTEHCIAPGSSYDITGNCVENPNPQDPEDRNIMMRGGNEPTFLISSRSEKEIEGKLRRQAMRGIFGGGAVATASLAFLLLRLGWL